MHGRSSVQIHLECFRELLEPQETDGRDPERQFAALTSPMTMAAQLKAAFAWAALKVPQ